MKPTGIGLSEKGKDRSPNEDFVIVDDDLGLYIISDGMGGYACGEVASMVSAQAAQEHVRQRLDLLKKVRNGDEPVSFAVKLAEDAVDEACTKVYDDAVSREECRGMGSTLTLLLIVNDNAIMAHVGNTRLYVLRKDEVHQLSADHTIGYELQRAGGITLEQLRDSPYRNVLTRAIGRHPSVMVDTLLFQVMPEDRFLLCSNGLSQYLKNDNELKNILSRGFEDIPDLLVDFAQSRGGNDDVSVAVVSIEAEDAEEKTGIKQYWDVIYSVPLFEDLSFVQLQRLLNISNLKTYEEGDTILSEGDRSDKFYLVLDGRVKVIRDMEEIGVLEPGDMNGLSRLVQKLPSRVTLRALTPSKLLVLDGKSLNRLIHFRPRLGVEILQRIASRLSSAVNNAK